MRVRNADQVRAFAVGRQCALRATDDAMTQLADQLREARAELEDARREYAEKISAARNYFDGEVRAMRAELAESLSQLHQLRESMFNAWTPRSDAKQ
jgi:F0F1-type ATP synthase membrane subunit b/b'